jgi:hypothetical protein
MSEALRSQKSKSRTPLLGMKQTYVLKHGNRRFTLLKSHTHYKCRQINEIKSFEQEADK